MDCPRVGATELLWDTLSANSFPAPDLRRNQQCSACTLVLCCGQRQRIHCQCICQGWHAPNCAPSFSHKMSSSTQTAISALPRRCSCQKIFVVKRFTNSQINVFDVVADNLRTRCACCVSSRPFVRAMCKGYRAEGGRLQGQFPLQPPPVASHNIDMAN